MAETARMRVLVVEDNLDISRMMVELLSTSGYEPQVAHDGLAALRAVETALPDVVLLDIDLPGDGWEVARRIRGQVPEKQPVIIAVTAYWSSVERRRSEEVGIDFHLTKPANLNLLMSVLELLCREAP